ncbi:NEDD8 ultimate buster 1-like, partial [Seriola lalandi dorsalis]|uniref:NEDD8 ultimate buster 1-like n=1 Tax=Seriola lalandi dorsalis TaxID=1841481 RepID=UPI000C6F95CA
MAEQNTEAKLKNLLKQKKIQLWNPPYTDDDNQPGQQHMEELAQHCAPLLGLSVAEVGGALESVRVQAVNRGKGNKTYRETNVATLELLLPRDSRKDPKSKKTYLETRLDVLVQEVVDRIGDDHGLKYIKLILNGKTLCVDQRLDEQGVKNHSKMMVLKVSDAELKRQMSEEEQKKKEQNESLQRTQKGFQILSERGALILAMGFHEKGRSLMKRKQYDNALCHLLQADQQFRIGDDHGLKYIKLILNGKTLCVDQRLDEQGVKNHSKMMVLKVSDAELKRQMSEEEQKKKEQNESLQRTQKGFQILSERGLDIVWCYRALEALSCLDDGKSRLRRAEDCFLQCYGEQRERLRMIKGNTGREEVLFLRLYLLQSLLSYLEGNDGQAQQQLSKVESLFSRLCLDSEKMAQLMALGFSEREARLGLRACQGDLEAAANHISSRRQEQEELKQRERQK